MKKTKVVLALACAVLLVAASVMGTLAYLTSAAKVENTFTVGKVQFGDGEQQAGLDEAKVNEKGQPVDESGKVTTLVAAPRVQKNDYKLQPGHQYTKDPTIHINKDSDSCYVFVKVENSISDIEAKSVAPATDDSYRNIADQMKKNGWKSVDGVTNVYVYVGTATGASNPLAVEVDATKGTDIPVFGYFKIADNVTNDKLKEYAGEKIIVTAYGVQADGFEEKTAAQIWTDAGFADMTVSIPETKTETETETSQAGGGETPVDPAE